MSDLISQKKEYLTKMALASLKRTANEYVNLSQICHEYHQEFGYQDYSRWIKDDLGIGITRGQQLLSVYEQFGVTTQSVVNNLPVAVMFLLAAPSTPESARTEAIEKAENGEKLTIKQTKELVEAHKRIDSLQQELESSRSQKPTEDMIERIYDLEAALESEKKKPAIVQTVKEIPSDYEHSKAEVLRLVEEKGRMLNQINRMKENQTSEVEQKVNQKIKSLDDEFNLKNGQLKAVQDRIDFLRESMKSMDKTAGDMVACKKACDQIRGFLLEISIALRDLFEDHKLTESAEREMRHLCGELEQGAVAFRKYLDGETFVQIGEE